MSPCHAYDLSFFSAEDKQIWTSFPTMYRQCGFLDPDLSLGCFQVHVSKRSSGAPQTGWIGLNEKFRSARQLVSSGLQMCTATITSAALSFTRRCICQQLVATPELGVRAHSQQPGELIFGQLKNLTNNRSGYWIVAGSL